MSFHTVENDPRCMGIGTAIRRDDNDEWVACYRTLAEAEAGIAAIAAIAAMTPPTDLREPLAERLTGRMTGWFLPRRVKTS